MAADDVIAINRVGRTLLRIPIVGTGPLIVHRFSEKAKKQMLDNMQGRKAPKEPKNPDAEYQACFYRYKDNERTGFPVIAFKAATVSAARYYGKNVSMVGLRQQIFFLGEIGVDGQMLVEIEGTPQMREDVTRVGMGGTDLRYRPEYPEWRTMLQVLYVDSALTQESVLSLVDAGGMGVGVGEWRPEKRGDFGTYCIDPERTIEVSPYVPTIVTTSRDTSTATTQAPTGIGRERPTAAAGAARTAGATRTSTPSPARTKKS